MPLDVMGTLRRGVDRMAVRNGLPFVGLFFLLSVIFVTLPLAVFSPVSLLSNLFAVIVLGGIGGVAASAVAVVTVRALAAEPETSLRNVFRRRIGIATVSMVVGQVLMVVIVGAGFLLIIPGVYLIVSLVLWPVSVAVEGRGAIDSLRRSWKLTQTHKWRLVGVLVGLLAVWLIGEGVAVLVTLPLEGTVFPSIVIGLTTSVLEVYTFAVLVEVYRQVT